MANAEEEEADEEEERTGRYKKEDETVNTKRASENEVTVNKELMKQFEESVYNRVVTFIKAAAPTGGDISH